jgi:hypothetical protein
LQAPQGSKTAHPSARNSTDRYGCRKHLGRVEAQSPEHNLVFGKLSRVQKETKSSVKNRHLKRLRDITLMSKSELLLNSLDRFFSEDANAGHLVDILNHRKGVSLRNLEWFVTNYSKSKNLTYTTPSGKTFTVHVAYKSSLDGYSKKLFDPFCRTERIQYKLPSGEEITTTVAQLNFIRWCITNGIIEYLVTKKPTSQTHC